MAERKSAMALFYQDSGPREEWDYLLNKQASYLSRSRGWKGKVREKKLGSHKLDFETSYFIHFKGILPLFRARQLLVGLWARSLSSTRFKATCSRDITPT